MLRVLAVDDDPTVRDMLELILELEGFDVRLAATGHEALHLAQVWEPDVVLLDVMMPGFDGFHVAAQLRERASTAGIPIVFVSAKAGADDVLTGWQHGAESYITKPFDTDELVDEIIRVAGRVTTPHALLGRDPRAQEGVS